MKLRSTLARNLRRLREERDLSQEDLSGISSVHRTYISALENERYSASLDKIEALATALEIDPLELLTSKNAEHQSRDKNLE